MIRDKDYYKNIKSKKFKIDNYEKGNRKQGWIKNSKKKFNEQSPYQNWVNNREGIDPLNLEELTDDETPWSSIPLSDTQTKQLEILNELYPKLKKRQKEVAELLFRGYTSQAVIGLVLQISPQQVSNIIIAIRKKIEKRMKTYVD